MVLLRIIIMVIKALSYSHDIPKAVNLFLVACVGASYVTCYLSVICMWKIFVGEDEEKYKKTHMAACFTIFTAEIISAIPFAITTQNNLYVISYCVHAAILVVSSTVGLYVITRIQHSSSPNIVEIFKQKLKNAVISICSFLAMILGSIFSIAIVIIGKLDVVLDVIVTVTEFISLLCLLFSFPTYEDCYEGVRGEVEEQQVSKV
eukprot:TRINITY_DN5381_c0_g1_i2.p1 TRINITY_DN5381_c0_g1~~TRINITY_DN5381_c0_g1_i2.p1  ORF type:complete len:205 (+),score=-10.48 TRINITY_DN5381_c0_g1_i2:95-709(+)